MSHLFEKGYNPETVKPLSFLEQQFAFTKSDYKVDMPSKEDEVENENDVNTRFQEIGIVEDGEDFFYKGTYINFKGQRGGGLTQNQGEAE